jgi:hypothetical protein
MRSKQHDLGGKFRYRANEPAPGGETLPRRPRGLIAITPRPAASRMAELPPFGADEEIFWASTA